MQTDEVALALLLRSPRLSLTTILDLLDISDAEFRQIACDNQRIRHLLEARNQAKIKTIELLDKQSRREADITADWIGFSIPDEFVVGYGIDFAQRNRNLPFIGKVRFTDE